MFSFNDQSLLQDPTHLPESSSMMCAGPWYEQISEQHFFNNASWSTTIVHNTQLSMQKNDKSSSRRENSQRVRDSNAVYWQRKLLYFPLHWKNTTTVYLLEKKLQPFYYFLQQIRSPLPVFHIFKQFCRKNRGQNKTWICFPIVLQLYSILTMHSTMLPNNDIILKDQCFGYRRTELE